jgi:DNA-binding MarR family transcriptional regulator
MLDQAADIVVRRLSDRAGMSHSAAFTLIRLDREGPMRLTMLAEKEGISQPAMTQLVQRLERQDFVVRQPNPTDGRGNLVALSAAGRDLLARRTLKRRRRLEALLSSLTDSEIERFWLAAEVVRPILERLGADFD